MKTRGRKDRKLEADALKYLNCKDEDCDCTDVIQFVGE